MQLENTPLDGAFVLQPKLWEDSRGFFFESYSQSVFEKLSHQKINFVQDNIAFSTFGVIRGLHIQNTPHSQSKLVQVLQGKIIDVIIDVRNDSSSFGESFAIELSFENKKQLFIPKGFLHGYSVLSPTAYVSYKCDDFYHKETEMGINPLDTDLAIDWQIPTEKQVISDKDLEAMSYARLIEKLK